MTDFNPFSHDFWADPYPAYARLRAEAPVARTSMGGWAVSRYDDVCYVLKTPEVFSSQMWGPSIDGRGTRTVIATDPPDHTYLRNLVNRAFTPRMVAEMEPRIREIARDYIGRARAAGEMDIVEGLAVPLPVTVIAEILGVETERRDDFKRWSNTIVGSQGMGQPGGEPQDMIDFRAYFADAVARRQRQPSDDLISALVRAGEDSGGKLTTDEIVAFAMLLLIAGNETTTNLIGNAMQALLQHPEQLSYVMEDSSRIPNMVEEALRWESPVQFLFRRATRDVELGGVTIAAGETVLPMYASANRDSAKFPNGERFDVTGNAQGHVAFGLGPHFCLGAPLARLEAKVAFEELFAAAKDFRALEGASRLQSLFLRGMRALPVAFTPA